VQQLVQKLKTYFTQGYHSSDNVKFPDNSMTFPWRFLALLAMLSVTHITPILVSLSVVGAGMQQCMIRNQKKIHKLSTGWPLSRQREIRWQFPDITPTVRNTTPWHSARWTVLLISCLY